jgi:hypothetical protein
MVGKNKIFFITGVKLIIRQNNATGSVIIIIRIEVKMHWKCWV